MKHVDDATLQEIVRRLVAEFQPEAVILFGSHAWGTPTEDSDLDLLVIVSESDERPAARDTRAYEAVGEIPVSMDILVHTRDEVEPHREIHASLYCRILEEGKVLYARDHEAFGRPAVARHGK
jgi:predicted nucleotidyltransferase